MDVSDLVNSPQSAEFYISVAAIIGLAAAALASVAIAVFSGNDKFWFVAGLSVALTLPLTGFATEIHENGASQRDERLQSRIFESYGVSLREPAGIVKKIDESGSDGVVTDVQRGETISEALLRFEDGKLTIKDASGHPIPTITQTPESSK